MPKKQNKKKVLRRTFQKTIKSLRGPPAQGPIQTGSALSSHTGLTESFNWFIGTHRDQEMIEKVSIIGPRLLKILSGKRNGCNPVEMVQRYKQILKFTRREVEPTLKQTQILRSWIDEITEHGTYASAVVVEQAWAQDIQEYINKNIGFFKKAPMYPAGTLLEHIEPKPLILWNAEHKDAIIKLLLAGRRPRHLAALTQQQMRSPSKSSRFPKLAVKVMSGSSLFVTEEMVVLGETETMFCWNRVFTVLTQNANDKGNKPCQALMCFNAAFPRQKFAHTFKPLRPSSSPNKYPKIILPDNPGTKQNICFLADPLSKQKLQTYLDEYETQRKRQQSHPAW